MENLNSDKIQVTLNDIKFNLKIMQSVSSQLITNITLDNVVSKITESLPELKAMMVNLENDLSEFVILNKYLEKAISSSTMSIK